MEIRRNDPSALRAFAALNMEWIEELHHVEESDRKMAEDPSYYMAGDNVVISLHDGNIVAGVCALKQDEDGDFELTKLAVDKAYRRQGLGRVLMDEIDAVAREKGLKQIYLLTSTKNKEAVALYHKLGWRVMHEGEHPKYSRCDIGFEKDITS